ICFVFFFSSRRRHTRFDCDWSSDVCSSDLVAPGYDMARTVARALLGQEGTFAGADMSTKLKLMGVDVASIGDAHGATPGSRSYRSEERRVGKECRCRGPPGH